MSTSESVKKSSSAQFYYFLVIIMLSTLTSIFSSSSQAEQKQMYPRQINLSGNIFHFAIPEDFSKDMPAADMIEALDISDPAKFDNPEYANLLRRWWDIKKPGWFGKQLGTVMMDISVQRVFPNMQHLLHNRPYDITDRLDFMLMLDDSYHQRYDALNESNGNMAPNKAFHSGFAIMIGDDVTALQRDVVFNLQKWTSYSIAAPRDELIVIYAIPLTENIYLEVLFTYSHNNNVLPLVFRRDYAFPKFQETLESFKIDYAEGNHVENLVSKDWLDQSTTDALKRNDALLLKIFDATSSDDLLRN